MSVKRTSYSVKGPPTAWKDRELGGTDILTCLKVSAMHMFFGRIWSILKAFWCAMRLWIWRNVVWKFENKFLCQKKARAGNLAAEIWWVFLIDCSEANLVQLENRKQKRQRQRTGRKKFCCVPCARPLGSFVLSCTYIGINFDSVSRAFAERTSVLSLVVKRLGFLLWSH